MKNGTVSGNVKLDNFWTISFRIFVQTSAAVTVNYSYFSGMRMILNVWTTFNKINGYSGVLPLCGKEPLLCFWSVEYRDTATLEVWNIAIFYLLNEDWVMVILLLSSYVINCTLTSRIAVQSILCHSSPITWKECMQVTHTYADTHLSVFCMYAHHRPMYRSRLILSTRGDRVNYEHLPVFAYDKFHCSIACCI